VDLHSADDGIIQVERLRKDEDRKKEMDFFGNGKKGRGV